MMALEDMLAPDIIMVVYFYSSFRNRDGVVCYLAEDIIVVLDNIYLLLEDM